MSLIKVRLLDTAQISNKNFSSVRDLAENLTSNQFQALKYFLKKKNIVIQKEDKGNNVVILDKYSYVSAIEEILNDNGKFSKLDIPAGKDINNIIDLEKRITSEIKLLKIRK